MSLFGGIGKIVGKVLKGAASSALGKVALSATGLGGVAGTLAATALSGTIQKKLFGVKKGVRSPNAPAGWTTRSIPSYMAAGGKNMSMLPALVRGAGGSLPPIIKGVGKAMGGFGGGVAVGSLFDQFGNQVKKRRRRKGISAKDLQSFKRVARLVDKFSKPVHHFRNFKKGQ